MKATENKSPTETVFTDDKPSKKARKPLITATKVRWGFWGINLLIWLAGLLIFLFFYTSLHKRAAEISVIKQTAASTDSNYQAMTLLKKQLTNNAESVKRAEAIVADSKTYTYQDQIIRDLEAYAKDAKVEISNISFSAKKAAKKIKQTTKDPVTGVETTKEVEDKSSLASTTATVTLINPLNYDHLLDFIYRIEKNLTKMQIKKVDLSDAKKSTTGGITSITVSNIPTAKLVNVQALIIEVYMK